MSSNKYVTITRRGIDIVLSKALFKDLKDNGVSLTLTSTSPYNVQMFQNKQYVGLLKNELGVTSFKNGNVHDFHQSNLTF